MLFLDGIMAWLPLPQPSYETMPSGDTPICGYLGLSTNPLSLTLCLLYICVLYLYFQFTSLLPDSHICSHMLFANL